jgi:hypothetical protein
MPDVRTYRLGDTRCIVKVRGELDSAAVAAVAPGAAVVDLLDAQLLDLDVLDALVAGTDAIFVVGPSLRHALDVIALHRPVRTAATLAAALS